MVRYSDAEAYASYYESIGSSEIAMAIDSVIIHRLIIVA